MPAQKLTQLVDYVLTEARRCGVDDAEVSLSQEKGFAVTARDGDVETLEHHQDKGLMITVYKDQRTGSASTSDLSKDSIYSSLQKAISIAKFSGQDPFAGIADADDLAMHYPDLSLYHPWQLTPEQAIQMAIECEAIARKEDTRITRSEGANINTFELLRVYGNTHGFIGHYPMTNHSISCSVVAEQNEMMQRDYEYSASRTPQGLDDISYIAKRAAQKTVQRLGARKIKTQNCPVIFESSMAKNILGSFISAISGGHLYRRASFLLDHLHQKIFPEHVDIYQEPHLLGALGSSPFDSDGVKTADLYYIKNGILESYALGSYSARKMGMKTTGNAGGVHNLSIKHSDLSLAKLFKEMGKGLFVTELMGQGINMITGDYSRGASGYWIENGEIQFPVEEITIAGNLKTMFLNLAAVANDVDRRGNVRTGSILLEHVKIGGL